MRPARPVVLSCLGLLLACDEQPAPQGGSDGGEDTAGGLGGDLAAFDLGEERPCTTPLPEVRRSEVGGSWGLAAATEDPPHLDGGGLSLADLDGDGDVDVLLSHLDGFPELWLWEPGAGLVYSGSLEHRAGGQTAAMDLDGDSLPEILYAGPDLGIFWNEGGLEFSPELLVVEGADGGYARQTVGLDLEGDGLTDLYLPTSAPEQDRDEALTQLQDRILRQVAPRRFEVQSLGEVGRRDAFDGVPLDHDDDSHIDLYVLNDKGPETGPNVLWRNDGRGTLQDVSAGCDCDLSHSGMGGSAADFDGDGVVDLFLTATAHSRLLQGLGDGTYVDVTRAAGVDTVTTGVGMGWGSTWLDHDNDGRPDLLVGQGDLWVDEDDEEHAVFEASVDLLVQGPDGTFSDQGAAVGLPRTGSWRGVAAWDLDGDGVQELLMLGVAERLQVFASEGCTAAGWLAVDVPQGSRVRAEATDGRVHTAWTTTHPGYGATAPPRAWLGLGEAQALELLEVRLPGGETLRLEGHLPARRVITVARP